MTGWSGSVRVLPMFAMALLLTLSVLHTACGPGETAAPGKTLLYGFPMTPPQPDAGPDAAVKAAEAAENLARAAADVVTARVRAMGWDGVTVTTRAARDLRIQLPPDMTDQVGLVRAIVEGSGSLEIRLRAPPDVENACRPLQPENYPAGWRRLPRANPAPDDYLVVYAPEDLPPDPENPPANDVYTADDLASIEFVVEGGDNVLTFEMRPERKAAFTEFSKRNLESSVAIVIDGVAVSAPVIKSELPGSGKIARDGEGFGRDEAQSLAAILSHPMPCPVKFITME